MKEINQRIRGLRFHGEHAIGAEPRDNGVLVWCHSSVSCQSDAPHDVEIATVDATDEGYCVEWLNGCVGSRPETPISQFATLDELFRAVDVQVGKLSIAR